MTDTTKLPRIGETKFDVLESVVQFRTTHSFGPTVEELRAKVGLKTRSSVQWHINHLMQDGLLENVPRKHRTLRATPRGHRLVEILRELG